MDLLQRQVFAVTNAKVILPEPVLQISPSYAQGEERLGIVPVALAIHAHILQKSQVEP